MRNAVAIAVITGLIVLVLVNLSILEKESLLEEGEVVFLELAPVDPRSLMQGDYMALRFAVGNSIREALRKRRAETGESASRLDAQDGVVVVTLDDRGVARFARIADQNQLADNQRLMQFRIRNATVKFATNAFFFQEGTAKVYETADYGEFRVAADGDLLLTGLRDKELNKLEPGVN
jgi:uncharacterized membrane-anchored protein